MKKFTKLFVVLSLLSSVLLLASPSFANNETTIAEVKDSKTSDEEYDDPKEPIPIDSKIKNIKPVYYPSVYGYPLTVDYFDHAEYFPDNSAVLAYTLDDQPLFYAGCDDYIVDWKTPGVYNSTVTLTNFSPTYNSIPTEERIYLQAKLPIIIMENTISVEPIRISPVNHEPDDEETHKLLFGSEINEIVKHDNYGFPYMARLNNPSEIDWNTPGVYIASIDYIAERFEHDHFPYNLTYEVPIIVENSTTVMTISPETFTLNTGKAKILTATITPESSETPTITWSSSDESIVKVFSNGKAQGVSPGTATITATTEDGLSATSKVTVE